ncbi:MAG: hypothetical protein L3J07_01100 [Candidatus Magasanikbacteria bacterium]|nr:hypothetical protein [Candidatus Magasanikbacteria bacterium]
MHHLQEKILNLLETKDISGLSLREIAKLINETGSPQKIKHHLDQLAKRGLIFVDKKNKEIKKIKPGMDKKTQIISLPILGSANCGVATYFAENHVEGYLKVTKNILGELAKRIESLFVLRAVGSSMNRANIRGNSIEDGDYVIVDSEKKELESGLYMVSIINDVANIKKVFFDKKNRQIVLMSESNQDITPIYIHKKDLNEYLIAGTVVKIMKNPTEENLNMFSDISAIDSLKNLGSLSSEEESYYNNADNFKKYA